MPSPTLSLIPVGRLEFSPTSGILDRIAIRPPLGFLFHPSVPSHAEELMRGRIMQITMVILLTIITIDRGEKKKRKRRKNSRLASDDAGIDAVSLGAG